eukprot:m.322974 g.322974  ORF g.322974 m.322974 type:complete len:679 (+) comp16538_c1_seq1:2958-4994(+)
MKQALALLLLLFIKHSSCERIISSPCGSGFQSRSVFFLNSNNIVVVLRETDGAFGCVLVVDATTFVVKDSVKYKLSKSNVWSSVAVARSDEVFVLCDASYRLNWGPRDVYCTLGSFKSSSLFLKPLTAVNTIGDAPHNYVTDLCAVNHNKVLVVYIRWMNGVNKWDVFGVLLTVNTTTLAYTKGSIVNLSQRKFKTQSRPTVHNLEGQDAVLMCWSDDSTGVIAIGCSKLSYDSSVPKVIGNEMWAFGIPKFNCQAAYIAHCGRNASFVLITSMFSGGVVLRVLKVDGATPVPVGPPQFINDSSVINDSNVLVIDPNYYMDLHDLGSKCILSYSVNGTPTVAGYRELQVDSNGDLLLLTNFIAFQNTSVDTAGAQIATSGSQSIVVMNQKETTFIRSFDIHSSTSSTTTSTYSTSSVTTSSETTSSVTDTTTTTSTSSSTTTTTSSTTTTISPTTTTTISTTTSSTTTTSSATTSSFTTSVTTITTSTLSNIIVTVGVTATDSRDTSTVITTLATQPILASSDNENDNDNTLTIVLAVLIGVCLCGEFIYIVACRTKESAVKFSTFNPQTMNPTYNAEGAGVYAEATDPNDDLYVEPSVQEGHQYAEASDEQDGHQYVEPLDLQDSQYIEPTELKTGQDVDRQDTYDGLPSLDGASNSQSAYAIPLPGTDDGEDNVYV